MAKKPDDRPFAQKSTVRSRREAEKRAAERHAAYEAALRESRAPRPEQPSAAPRKSLAAAAGPSRGASRNAGSPTPPSLVKVPPLAPSLHEQRIKGSIPKEVVINPNRRLAGYATLLVLAVLATALMGAPILGQEVRVTPLVVGALISALCLERVLHWIPRASKKTRIASAFLMIFIFISFGMGVVNQVVIDGKVYPVWSETAKAFNLSEDIYDDLVVIRENDRYLALPAEQARTHSNEIVTAITSSRAIADRWNPSLHADAPSEAFLDTMRELNASADAQSKALDLLGQDLLQPDQGRQSNISSTRAASVQSFINATDQLRQASNPYGFDPTASEGPVE